MKQLLTQGACTLTPREAIQAPAFVGECADIDDMVVFFFLGLRILAAPNSSEVVCDDPDHCIVGIGSQASMVAICPHPVRSFGIARN